MTSCCRRTAPVAAASAQATTLVKKGDVADCMYIIHTGELRAVMAGDSGRTMELNNRVAGEFFGACAPSPTPWAGWPSIDV